MCSLDLCETITVLSPDCGGMILEFLDIWFCRSIISVV